MNEYHGFFRKKPVVVEAHRWFKNGDHPLDNSENDSEGELVRRYSHLHVSGRHVCSKCGNVMDMHGWVDTLEGGHVVCPGDWVITGVAGERYPCKPDIFERTYEPV